MGHVYKAEHRLMKRVVALKIASRVRHGARGSAVRKRFRREVEAAGRLHHPGIVSAYDAGEVRGRLYLAMEYVEGIDLERLVEESGPLSVDLACEIVRQTAEALHHAHERGLLHRDIKPSNLMLAAPGVTVKLLDLGLARLAHPSFPEEEEAADDPLCGTPDFMAPEWGRDVQPADVRGDLYSLGCTFYFLLTGQVPYPGGSGTEKLLRHSLDAPAPLRQVRPETPPAVVEVVERLMARDLEDRYPTAAAVAAAIAAIHDPKSDRDGIAGAVQPTNAARRMVSSRFAIAALVAVLLGVGAAAGARRVVEKPVAATAQARTFAPSFRIEGREEGFPSLAQAIAAARDGDVVSVHGSGPFVTASLNCRGKALTVRAAQGVRPRLERKPTGDPSRALFHTDRALTLEGLDLVVADNAPMICCEGAPLHLTDCRLTTGADGVAVIARAASEVVVCGCRIDAGAVGLSVEAGQGSMCRVHVRESRITIRAKMGVALSLWASEVPQPTPVELELEGNTIQAGRTAALRALPAGLAIRARGNRFTFHTALLSYTGYADPDAWRRNTAWAGGDNAYEGPPSWLWVEGQPVPLATVPMSVPTSPG